MNFNGNWPLTFLVIYGIINIVTKVGFREHIKKPIWTTSLKVYKSRTQQMFSEAMI